MPLAHNSVADKVGLSLTLSPWQVRKAAQSDYIDILAVTRPEYKLDTVLTILFSILCSTGVLIVFKLLGQIKANSSHTIFLSYLVSAVFGLSLLPVTFNGIHPIWFFAAALEGISFFAVFHLIARSTALSGVAFTGVASKMSVVIPITIGLLFLSESGNAFIFIGILLGLAAVCCTVSDNIKTTYWHWPVLVFLGAGLIDASFKLFQVWGLAEQHFPAFIVTTFACAFATGIVMYLIKGEKSIALPSLMAGAVLGLLNLGTVYFLMNALAIDSLESAVVYALNNFGIVLMSMIVAIAIFRETISKRGYAGIALAFSSIVCLYASQVR